MKTKNIFKTLAFAMLMPAMMLTTACSSDDSIINTPEKTENTTGKVYEIPITINATRQGDDATTRAEYTYDSDTGLGHLSFTTGDQLFVSGEHQLAGNFSGTLNWDGGTVFIGTIRTENQYQGTAIQLLNSADYCDAFLLPEGYTNYNYFTISKVNPNDPNSIESVTTDVTEAFTTSKTTAIEQFSEEWASWKRYDDEQGLFSLFPQNAILNFTITGLTPNSNTTTVSFHYPQAGSRKWSINKTVQTDNTGTATFAIGLSLMKAVYENLKNFSLSVDGKDITLVTEDKTLRAGHIYNITRSASGTPTPATGQFSVSATKKVTFSSGNLQATWDGSSWNWHFAENQWDYIGNAAGNTSINGNGTVSASNVTVDLFGWVGASNTTWSGDLGTTGNAAMHGISNSFDGYGDDASEALKSDWGNTINDGYTWFTLTSDEWTYLFNTRTVNGGQGSGKSYTLGQSVNDKLGVVIYPDDYTGSVYAGSDWSTFEAAGCVFLPVAGFRVGTQANVYDAGTNGFYWSSSPYDADKAYYVFFSSVFLNPAAAGDYDARFYGYSVRLVRQVE